jgi:hypothetical protein
MKFTEYFSEMRKRKDREDIKLSWIEQVVTHPEAEYIQKDGRIKRWARISEAGSKYLRVVLLEDRETVHNAFFDRSFKEV